MLKRRIDRDRQICEQIIQKSFMNRTKQFTKKIQPNKQFLYESDRKAWVDVKVFQQKLLPHGEKKVINV